MHQDYNVSSSEIKKVLEYTQNMQILYVEDNEDVQISTKTMLDVLFSNVDLANNGDEGYNYFHKNKYKYDMIFSDIEMPICDGINMTKKIRIIDKKIPIILLSAYDNKNYLLEAIRCDILDYIIKPYNLQTIINVIKKVLDLHHNNHFIELVDNYRWNSHKNSLYKNEEEIELTKNERVFLKTLINAKGSICSSEILEDVIFETCNYDNKRIRNIVTKLKNKLDASLVKSIYAEGYKIIIQ